jgi:hypothetical protein
MSKPIPYVNVCSNDIIVIQICLVQELSARQQGISLQIEQNNAKPFYVR